MKAPPSISWVNHASYVLGTGAISVITDPWLFGSAFNNGWDLVSPTVMKPENFSGIQFIWFSHEHPDHFAPLVLKAIPAEIRSRITVLFQETSDGKVLRYCGGLGFQTRELELDVRHEIGERTSVICGRVGDYDSWLFADCDGVRVLNLNDCTVETLAAAEKIHALTGDVDVLLTQFSYANGIGNPADVERRRRTAHAKLLSMKTQASAFRPRYLIPFASFIYFSHEENFFMNDEANRMDRVCRFIEEETGAQPIVLHPGQRWEIGSAWDNGPALEGYREDFDRASRPIRETVPVGEHQLSVLAGGYLKRVSKHNHLGLVRAMAALLPARFPLAVKIFLWDLERVFVLDLRRGLYPVPGGPESADVEMSTESLAFIFQFDWGISTLEVNGRFRGDPAGRRKLLYTFRLGPINNVGRRFGVPYLMREGLRRVGRRLGASGS